MNAYKHSYKAWLLFLCVSLCSSLVPFSAGQVATTAEHQQFVFAYRLLQKGDTIPSADAFDKYLQNFPQGEKRGDALYFRALLAWQAGQKDKAKELLINVPAMKVVPEHKLHFLRGRVEAELGNYDAALRSLEPIAADKLEPAERGPVLYMRGLAYRGAKNLTAAAEQFKAAAALDSPVKDRSLLELGRALALQNKPEEAVKALDQCLALGNTAMAAEAARLAGNLLYETGKYEEALRYYGQVIAHHQTTPHFAPAVLQSLWSLLNAKQPAKLLAMFEQYKAKLNIDDRAAAWLLAGWAHQDLGRHKEAIGLFDTVLESNPRSAVEDQLLYRKAVSQFALGELDAMSATIARLNKDRPKSRHTGDGEYLLAQADLLRNRTTEAAARLTAIVNQGPASSYYLDAMLNRARLYQATDNLDAAVRDYEAYLKLLDEKKLDPPHVNDVLATIADLYYRLGKKQESADTVQRLLARPGVQPLEEQRALFRKALVLVEFGKLPEAAATLDELTKKHPENKFTGQIAYYRGLMLLSDSKVDDAVKQLQLAIAGADLPSSLRANALQLISLRQREEKNDDGAVRTLEELEKVIGLEKLRDADLLWLGRHYIHKEPRSAFKYLYPLVDVKRKVAEEQRTEALFLVGLGLRAVKQVDPAIESFKEVEARGHGYGLLARLETARTLAEAGKLSESLATYRGLMIVRDAGIASTAMLESAQIQRRMGDDSKRVGDSEGAAAAYEESWQLFYRLTVLYPNSDLSPTPELAHLNRAELAKIIGKPKDYMDSLEELRERFKDSPFAAYAEALQLMEQQRPAEAANVLRKLRQQTLDARLAARVQERMKELEK